MPRCGWHVNKRWPMIVDMMEIPAKPRRSDATRAAILAAARERFAADGYERATIRVIASQAEIDPAMVMRYFGSKEGLFAAAAQFDLRLPDLRSVPRESIGETLVSHFIAVWENSEIFFALLRSAVTHEAAADRMRAIFQSQVVPALAAVVSEPASLPTRAGLISSTLLGLALARYVLKLPPVRALERRQIIANLAPVLQRFVSGKLD
jgi:AcrR family transcriptional regulator